MPVGLRSKYQEYCNTAIVAASVDGLDEMSDKMKGLSVRYEEGEGRRVGLGRVLCNGG